MNTPVKLWMVVVVAGIGVVFGLVLAPAISAMRPPRIQQEVVQIVTGGNVLNDGVQCVYLWDGSVHVWSRAAAATVTQMIDAGTVEHDATGAVAKTTIQQVCPSLERAKAEVTRALLAPVPIGGVKE